VTAVKTCGILYVVATPIGNLADLSERARKVLGEVDIVAAEDTRHSGKLLQLIGVNTRMISLHEHNERQRSAELLKHLQSGKNIALISDAGTPLISDPGFNLVRDLVEHNVRVVPVPGACAAISALSVCGLPTDRFVFEGFLPTKAGKRREYLGTLRSETRTLVFYESPHRIQESLVEMQNVFGSQRRAVVCRELTKVYETNYYGTLGELCERAEKDVDMSRGEIVIVVAGDDAADEYASALDAQTVLDTLLTELPASQAAKFTAKLCNVDRAAMYELAVQRKKS
jgi:16S rRNA (cytidine1402-2'-O)-methyltransferase